MKSTPTAPLKITPMFEQYLSIKAEHKDALLFFRMGDFYELFFEDAEIAARELQIALTSRNGQAENPIPMCGIPHHACENYLSNLLGKGYTVAICDQISNPKSSKGLVKRAVTSVRTPGTAVEDASLIAKANNYLGAIFWDKEKESGGFTWLEFSTGAWSGIATRKKNELWQWVQKLQPKELIIPDISTQEFSVPKSTLIEDTSLVRLPIRTYFDIAVAKQRILKAQQIQELGAAGIEGKNELIRACGAMLAYLLQTQKQELNHLQPFKYLDISNHMVIDEITERNLELFKRFDGKTGSGTLWSSLDETMTSMGGRLLEERLRNPWRSVEKANLTADCIEFFFNNDNMRSVLRKSLSAVYDIERLTTRIHLGRAIPRDMVALRQSLSSLAQVEKSLSTPLVKEHYQTQDDIICENAPIALKKLLKDWDNLTDIASLLEKALVDSPPQQITDGGLFKFGFNAELDDLLDLAEHGESRMQSLLREEQEKNKLQKLKLGYNRVFGYYFELPRVASEKAPDYFLRRQSLANAERFITDKLKTLEERILAAGEKRNQLEYQLFQELRKVISSARTRISFMAGAIAALDYWQSLAEVARKGKWVRPILHDGIEITIKEGRHPVVEACSGTKEFIPNDLRIDEKRKLILITGPNMSGKSTVLRQMAIITILAQMGSFVPAKEAKIGVIDRVFSRVGASDNLAQGQSTFMVEMMETARILRQATKNSLVILDEIGRGTSTFDGLAIAWAVVENLLQRSEGSIRTLFATHYHELTGLEGRLSGVYNMTIAIKEWGGDIMFLHRLIPGPADRSYGIEVAKLAGVPQTVVKRSKKILEALNSDNQLKDRQEATTVMEQMLPGVSVTAKKKTEVKELPEQQEKIDHPILSALKGTDINQLSPMQAFSLIHEWKELLENN